jgi:hypothetical protein
VLDSRKGQGLGIDGLGLTDGLAEGRGLGPDELGLTDGIAKVGSLEIELRLGDGLAEDRARGIYLGCQVSAGNRACGLSECWTLGKVEGWE